MATTATPSPPTIPRDAWSSHPHYPAQVLLLGSHDNFRQISAYLVQAARDGVDSGRIGALFRRWIAGMRSHEAYEEYKLYPYLAHRWGVSFDTAQAGHEALHEKYDAVIAALDGDDAEALTAALQAHDEILDAHLEVEEDLVIPLLLALTPDEFQRYYYGRISDLIPGA